VKVCTECGTDGCPFCDPKKIAEQKLRPLLEMPFGKHKGQHIEEVPTSYIRWLLDQDWVAEKFGDLFDASLIEIEFRKMWGENA
jgi:uncharacterized protein (DUF3820 family)